MEVVAEAAEVEGLGAIERGDVGLPAAPSEFAFQAFSGRFDREALPDVHVGGSF